MNHKHIIDFKIKPFLEELIGCRKHVYGKDHDLIGKPCLYQTYDRSYAIAIPYGAYIVDAPEHGYKDELLLVVAYISDKKVQHCSAIKPEALIPIQPDNIHARTAFHMIISGSYEDVRKENVELKQRIIELEKEINP